LKLKNAFNARKALDKAIPVGGSNIVEIWWQSHQPADGQRLVEVHCGDFTAFFPNIRLFRHILV